MIVGNPLRSVTGRLLPTWTAGVSSALNPATQALIAAFTTPPTQQRVTDINNAINLLDVTYGIWSQLDSLYVHAAADSQAARVDWRNPARTATLVNSPTFTADRGFQTNGSTSYVDTNVALSATTKYTQNNCTIGIWLSAGVGSDAANDAAFACGAFNAHGTFYAARSSASQLRGRSNTNSASAAFNGAVTTRAGLSMLVRQDGSNVMSARNGVVLGTTTSTATGLPTSNVIAGGYNNGGSLAGASDNRIQAMVIGAGLTSQQIADLYTALNGYMTAVGAN